MDPFASGRLRIDTDDDTAPAAPPPVAAAGDPLPGLLARRADIDTKQAAVGRAIEALSCEAAILLAPAHVAWFTAGMNVRGLFAESERPGIFTNGRQRWLLCANVDTQRLFDEELDGLGFQLKEWRWEVGRAELLYSISSGHRVASDRPFPNIPQISDQLRPQLRVLSDFELPGYRELGRIVAHALEATARTLTPGQSEEEIAGQIGHRLLHHGVEPQALSVVADDRGLKFRRAGFTAAIVQSVCTLQATAQLHGLYATASRTVAFGPVSEALRMAFDSGVRLSAVYRSLTRPEESLGTAKAAGQALLANTPFEYDWRFSQPGYGTGRFPAEELRRAGQDERIASGQALVWQARLGPAALVDTVLATPQGADAITPAVDWPIKRVTIRGQRHDIPDLLVRSP